ncbi:hypothetical protein Droror1_Dr00000220 [Drosera rotundifolia]
MPSMVAVSIVAILILTIFGLAVISSICTLYLGSNGGPLITYTLSISTKDVGQLASLGENPLVFTTHDTVVVNPLSPKVNVTSLDARKNFVVNPLSPKMNVTYVNALLPLRDFELTPRALQFEGRVREFIRSEDCRRGNHFFITWISPVVGFDDREFLVFDSLFKTNPEGCLVILSNTMDSEEGRRILNPLTEGGYRILAVTPDLPFLLEGTPGSRWFQNLKEGKVAPGFVSLAQNLSNLMRLAYLYKYGGVYLDTDVIVLKSFQGLRNVIGAQSETKERWTRLNNAVLVFDKGHPLVLEFITEFARTFNGSKWGHNGPNLVSRVVERAELKGDTNFTVLPPSRFYPVNWVKITRYFNRPMNVDDEEWVEAKVAWLREWTYGLHLWNKQSRSLKVEEGSVIDRLVKENCVLCREVVYRS